MSKYRTAQGKTLDMAALISRNERVRAVGNMKVNARGDTIDSQGRIIQPVTQKVTDAYSKTVGNRSARVKKTEKQAAPKSQPPKIVDADVTKEELAELEGFDSEAEVIEEIKKQETKRK